MTITESITIRMEVWIHSHFQTGEHIDWEFFSISGEDIPAELIHYLLNKDGADDVRIFSELESEQIYKVSVTAEYQPGTEEYLPGSWYIAKLNEYSIVPLEIDEGKGSNANG